MNERITFPLASIRGYAEIIDSKANYIKELVDDLNLTMKLKNGYPDIERKEKNIVALVRNVVIYILNDSNYGKVNIDFEYSEEKIVKLIDELLMKRVINNLLYNAILHNNENVSIRVSVIEDSENKVHIIIEDNGKGIPNEELKYIFERYYRGTNTGYEHKGSGLGIAIARDIVKAHNGDITIESTLGEGTKLEIIM